MKIFITGEHGKLGNILYQILQHQGYELAPKTEPRLDITNFEACQQAILRFQPDVVINCAAWTNVDGCANDPEKAILVNGIGAQNIALVAYQANASIVQISSNEVFDGKAKRSYYEYDQTSPINPYGYSKWYGEQAVMAVNPKHYIVRTSWLFAHGGRNFIQAILGAVEAGKALGIVVNEIANPTYTTDLAQGIAKLIQTERYGIYHLVNEGHCSRYDFARYFLNRTGHADLPIGKISSQQWQRPSQPPVYSSLINLAGQSVGINLRPWQEAVDAFLEKENLLKK